MNVTDRSAEDVRQDYRTKLGDRSGDIFYRVECEYLWLYRKWEEYKLLFGNEAHVGLLNAAAGGFWEDVRRALHENILLHICVLTDSPGSEKSEKPAEKPRLTVFQLPGRCRRRLAKRRTQRLLEGLGDDLKPFRRWRNERIAHRALPQSLNGEDNSDLRPPTLAATDRVVQRLHELLNVVREVELEYATCEQPLLAYRPRAGAFMAYLSGLVEVMHAFAASLGLDSDEDASIERASAILARVGYTDPFGRSTPLELVELSKRFAAVRRPTGGAPGQAATTSSSKQPLQP